VIDINFDYGLKGDHLDAGFSGQLSREQKLSTWKNSFPMKGIAAKIEFQVNRNKSFEKIRFEE
jgi:hypothetical protein